jgi:hypothetical protein
LKEGLDWQDDKQQRQDGRMARLFKEALVGVITTKGCMKKIT